MAGRGARRPVIRVGTVVLYGAMALSWINQATLGSPAALGLSWVAILSVPVFFGLRRQAVGRPVIELTILLLLTSVTFVVLQAEGAESWRVSAVALLLSHLNSEVLSLTLLIMPMLSLLGVGIAGFARRAAGWTVDVVALRLPGRAARAALLVVLVWQLRAVVLDALDRVGGTSIGAAALAYAGGLGVLLAVGLAWLVAVGRPGTGARRGLAADDEPDRPDSRRRWPSPDGIAADADRYALLVIVAYAAPQLISFLVLTLTMPILSPSILPAGFEPLYIVAVYELFNADGVTLAWRLLMAGLAVALGATRRVRPELGLFLATFGLTAAFAELARPDRPLGLFASYGGSASLVDAWWVLLFALVGGVWLARRRLTDDRVARLLLMLLTIMLLGQTDFISNRFSPFFGSGGVGFIAFGLAWDALTIGAWANHSTPALPRTSRIFLYLGYSLLTVTVVHWAVSVHDLTALSRLTGEAALDGLRLFGRPMLYAIFAVMLAGPPATPTTP